MTTTTTKKATTTTTLAAKKATAAAVKKAQAEQAKTDAIKTKAKKSLAAADPSAEPATKTRAVIRYNKAKAGIELVIPDGRRLSADELAVLRSLGFCWHKKCKYWYTKYSDEKMGIIKASFLGKEAQFPATTETKLMKQMAAEKKATADKAAKNPVKTTKAPKAVAKADTSDIEERFAAMEAKMAALVDAVTALAAMQAK